MNNKGISLISVVITVIVIIIISYIAIESGDRSPELAILSTFTHEVDDLRVALGTYRAESFEKNGDFDYGFQKVSVENAPDDFISLDKNSTTGYLINLDTLGYKPYYGKGSVTGDVVIFDVDDVYVYDKNGTVYYAKGYEDGDNIYYNATVYRSK